MKLRIISGTLKGRYITVKDNVKGNVNDFRPTQSRIRESVAEILKKRIRNCTTVDICAGSGSFGFEMLSRGASRVDFVEESASAASSINENAKKLGVTDRIRVLRVDVRKFIEDSARYIGGMYGGTDGGMDSGTGGYGYDIIYYDPPYADAELSALLPRLLQLVNAGGLLVYERRRRPTEKKTACTEGKAHIIDARVYADTVIELYAKDKDKEQDADSNLPGDV